LRTVRANPERQRDRRRAALPRAHGAAYDPIERLVRAFLWRSSGVVPRGWPWVQAQAGMNNLLKSETLYVGQATSTGFVGAGEPQAPASDLGVDTRPRSIGARRLTSSRINSITSF
jgi:hypothetical protein